MVCARVIGVCSSLSCSLDFDRVPTPRHHSLPPCHQSSSRLKTSTFCTSVLICRQKSEGRGFVGWGSLVCSNCSFWDAQHRGSPPTLSQSCWGFFCNYKTVFSPVPGLFLQLANTAGGSGRTDRQLLPGSGLGASRSLTRT